MGFISRNIGKIWVFLYYLLNNGDLSLREKCLYLELFWSVFSRIWIEYGDVRSISPYSVRMRGNTDQINSEYGPFLRSVYVPYIWYLLDCFSFRFRIQIFLKLYVLAIAANERF